MNLQHIIGRQVLELEIEDEGAAFRLQQEFGELCRTRVMPAMSAVLDRYANSEVVVRLDHVELDVGRLGVEQLDDEFVRRVCDALETRLLSELTTSKGESLSPAKHLLAIWHHVQLRGHLPWWATPAAATDLEHRVLTLLTGMDTLPGETRSLLRSHPVALQRVALQCPPELVERLLHLADESFAAMCRRALKTTLKLLEQQETSLTPDRFQRCFRQAALEESLAASTQAADIRLSRVLLQTCHHVAAENATTYMDVLARLHTLVAPRLVDSRLRAPVLQPALRRLFKSLTATSSGAKPSQRAPEDGSHADWPAEQQAEKADASELQEHLRQNADAPSSSEHKAPTLDDATNGETGKAEHPTPWRRGAQSEASGPAHENHRQHDDVSQFSSPPSNALPPAAEGNTWSVRAPSSNLPMNRQKQGTTPVAGGRDHAAQDPSPAERVARSEKKQLPHAPQIREGDAIYVDDAGLVLLHPFLRTHFEKLNLYCDREFVSRQSLEVAVRQLRYLATGEVDSAEYALVLSKILCGLAPDELLPCTATLDKQTRSEGEGLLDAVVKHWGALGNSSPDGLREIFLQREGRVEYQADGWHVRVDARSYDILLDRLPWSLSMIHLPWMTELIRVDWT